MLTEMFGISTGGYREKARHFETIVSF